jgi:hypothetical protein
MWYVYIIRSITFPEQEYTGATADLKRRIPDITPASPPTPQNSNPGNWFGIALFRINTKHWNLKNISNLTPAGHLRRSASDA